MFDPERLLGHLITQGVGGAFGGKRGRRNRGLGGLLGGGGMGVGTKAQLGLGLLGVAMAAYEHYTKGQSGGGGGGGSISDQDTLERPRPAIAGMSKPLAEGVGAVKQSAGFGVGRDAGANAGAAGSAGDAKYADVVLLVRAMVAAAAADGLIDDEERGKILKHVTDAGFDDETQKFLEAELAEPKALAAIVAASRPEIAADIYAASCIAITADTDDEKAYLRTLAKRLGVTDEQRAQVHEKLGIAAG